MHSFAVQKAGDIELPARQWLQRLFGRSLGEDEDVTVFVISPHAAPTGDERHAAFTRMGQVLDKAAQNMKDIPDAAFDEAADEAMRHIRKRTS